MNRSKEELSKCRFMTYEEGGMYYGIGWVRFRKIARKANAVFRMGKIYLVVKEVLDKYFEENGKGGFFKWHDEQRRKSKKLVKK